VPDARRGTDDRPGVHPHRCRGLLVDFGGVLTTSVVDSFRAFCQEHELPRDVVKEVFLDAYGSGEGPISRFETGHLSATEFSAGLAETLADRAGVPVEAEGLLARLFSGLEPDHAMLDAVLHARRAGVRTGLLSNSWGDMGYPRDRFGELFDAVVISGEVGLRKPDPAIFVLAADRLGIPPAECAFVDDLEANVAAARHLGMAGVVHRRAEETLPELAELLGLEAAVLAGHG
jgi:epoxide hydrolase-like predicted phosphatase